MNYPGAMRAAALLCIAVVVSACGTKGREGSRADSTGAAAPGAALPGTLTKPIDQYTGDELFQFVHGLRFGGGAERARKCKGNPGCDGTQPSVTTRVRVDAVEAEDSISAAILPANGVVAGRALNRGNLDEAMYGMRPEGTGGAFEYYLIVLPATSGDSATWRLEELATSGGARTHRAAKTGIFHQCGHPFQRGARADFKTCAQAAVVSPAAFTPALLQTLDLAPIWIGCALGCCTSDVAP